MNAVRAEGFLIRKEWMRPGALQSWSLKERFGRSSYDVETKAVGGYSCRRATTGSIRAARTAGSKPETTPTIARMMNDVSITHRDALRIMSPSWLAVLY